VPVGAVVLLHTAGGGVRERSLLTEKGDTTEGVAVVKPSWSRLGFETTCPESESESSN
jgi:hypothetical protein